MSLITCTSTGNSGAEDKFIELPSEQRTVSMFISSIPWWDIYGGHWSIDFERTR